MKAFKKFLAWTVTACLLSGVAALATACGNEEQSSSDTGSASVEDGKIQYTITIQKEDGSPLVGAEIMLYSYAYGEIVEEVLIGETGSAVLSLEEGEYSVWTKSLPENFQLTNTSIVVSAENTSAMITAIDNTPNGTAEKPFPLFPVDMDVEWNGRREVTLPANGGYYYSVIARGTLVIESADVTVAYMGTTYQAKNGVVTVALGDNESATMMPFLVTNTTNSELSVTITVLQPEVDE